jgi:HD-like signal output (HDOD) protein/GGDEF domain-containing protein
MPDSTSTGLVQQFVERTGQLYSLPAVAMEVLRLTSEPKIDARALKDCLERDPALTTRVLKVVNSSLFGLSRPVCDLTQALALLGTRPLKMLLLGFSLPKELFTGLTANVLARYWRHALIKAVAARELAEQVFHTPGDEAFTAGLVQDIGLFALIQQLGEPYLRLVDHCQTHGGDILERELETLGFDHGVLSARLLSRWGLPAELCAALAVPHDARRVSQLAPHQRTLPQVLHLADLLARLVEQPFGPALHELLQAGNSYCGLTFDQLRPVVAVLQNKVADLADVLALELPAGERYTDLLVAAQARLADMTVSAAAELAARSPEEELLDLTGQLRREVRAFAQTSRSAAERKSASQGHRSECDQVPAPRGRLSEPFAGPPIQSSGPAVVSPVAAEPGLAGRVAAATNRCRLARGPLSLALVAVDQYSDLLLHLGPAGFDDLLHWLKIDLAGWSAQRGGVLQTGEATFALLWENCPRSDAVETVRQVLQQVKTWRMPGPIVQDLEISLSAGVATLALPPKNFPAHQLVDAARRCLSGVQLSGGNAVKSIEF